MPRHGNGDYSPVSGTVDEQYRDLRWGLEPRFERTVTVPGMRRREAVAELGLLRVLYLRRPDGSVVTWRVPRPYPWLAVGAKSGRLWIVPRRAMNLSALAGMPKAGWRVIRTDYTALKGDEDAYWYHDHEAPFPRLYRVDGHVQYRGGGYFVAPEGIVG